MDQPRTDEPVRKFLERRERELMSSIATIKATLAPLETELVEVRRARGALGMTDQEAAKVATENARTAEQIDRQYTTYRELGLRLRSTPAASLKIKDLIAKAFLEWFSDGATPAEIEEYIASAYRRKVLGGSIRPNLARLRKDGVVMQGVGTRWERVPAAVLAIRHHYKGEGEDDGRLLAMATAFAWREDLPDGQAEPPSGGQ